MAGVVPVEAPPNRPGFGASPVFAAAPKLPKPDVDDAPAVAPPPPKRPPGLLAAGVLDAAPPNRPAPPELAPAPAPDAAPPNRPVDGVLDPVLAPPKRPDEGVLEVVLAPPKSPPAGLGVLEPALLLLGCPNVKPDMTALEDAGCRARELGGCRGLLGLL